jgi:hydroxymethylpyrimidine/phosphomethylpyrimidine kinase
VQAQLEAVFTDIRVDAVKIGMVANAGIIGAIAEELRRFRPRHVVVDPVMVAKSGDKLLQDEAISAMKNHLLPLATVITPNLPEAEVLWGRPIRDVAEMRKAAQALAQTYDAHVLVKGGHLDGDPVDVLSTGRTYGGERIATKNTHGTGCSLSAAIAAHLALGHEVEEAVRLSKEYVAQAIRHAFTIGRGHSPIHHFYAWWPKEEGEA